MATTNSTNKNRQRFGAINTASNELTKLKLIEFIDAIERLGVIHHACQAVGINNKQVALEMAKDATLADRIRSAQEIGKSRRRDYLESLAYEMAPTNPTMVMFLLKREDPSYRESYNVNSTSQPTNYVIDLGAASTSLDDAAAPVSTTDV